MNRSISRVSTVLLACCAGLTACSGVPPQAHIYSVAEKQMLRGSLGVPSAQLSASGEARYCSTRAAQKKQALANIAAVCGGEDRYFITDELVADVVYSTGLAQTTCSMASGRVIYFNCTKKKQR